jgi:hypothetical protein
MSFENKEEKINIRISIVDSIVKIKYMHDYIRINLELSKKSCNEGIFVKVNKINKIVKKTIYNINDFSLNSFSGF